MKEEEKISTVVNKLIRFLVKDENVEGILLHTYSEEKSDFDNNVDLLVVVSSDIFGKLDRLEDAVDNILEDTRTIVTLKKKYNYVYSSISLVIGKETNNYRNVDNFRELISSDIVYDRYGKLEEMKNYILRHESWLKPYSNNSKLDIKCDKKRIKELSYSKKT